MRGVYTDDEDKEMKISSSVEPSLRDLEEKLMPNFKGVRAMQILDLEVQIQMSKIKIKK